jgi:hypothetical protein
VNLREILDPLETIECFINYDSLQNIFQAKKDKTLVRKNFIKEYNNSLIELNKELREIDKKINAKWGLK